MKRRASITPGRKPASRRTRRIAAAISLIHCPDELQSEVRRAVRATIERMHSLRPAAGEERPAGGEIAVIFVSDRAISVLNQRWLGHVGPTDVLTFNLSAPAASRLDGEIVVSLDTARRAARAHRHSWQAEALLYVVHGVLHLFGLNDKRAAQRRRMHDLEDAILSELGIGAVYAGTGRAGQKQRAKTTRR